MNLRKHLWRVGLAWLALTVLLVFGGAIHLPPSRSTADPRGNGGTSRPANEQAMAHMVHPTLAAFVPNAQTLPPEGWTVTASSHLGGHPATEVLDADAASYWSSASSSSGALPQSITIDMRGPRVVSGLTYHPTQGTSRRGAIGRFEVGVSDDGANFRTVATGTWANTAAPETVGIDPMRTRFVRLTARSRAGAGTSVTAAGISLAGDPSVDTATSMIRAAALSTNPSVVGKWGASIGFPLVPAAAALLPNNKILVWSADEAMSFGGGGNQTHFAILDVTTGTVSPDTVLATHNMFCPGVAILPNGDIMVTGGLTTQETSIYHPATNSWSTGPPMNIGRGYQGQTLLSNGQVFTLGGSWSGLLGGKLGEVWSSTGSWRELTSVPATPMYTADPGGVYRADSHGWFIAVSGGKVLQAGPSKQMNWITTTGAGTITPAGLRGNSGDAMNGNAVYYDTNKVVTMGGAPAYEDSNATNRAHKITINGAAANVTQVGSMTYARAFANSVVLPNGQVVTLGGQTRAVPFSDADSVLNPELWNPATGAFSVMAPASVPRNYHSVGLLLPDGRVFSGGGGLCGTCDTNHADGQIYSPPYLFNSNGTLRTRPSISSAPTSAATGATITVKTGGPVSSFSIVRYGAPTHAVNNDQRRVPLSIVSSSGNTYRLAVPSDPGIALPGPYMLFALDANGTPSVSKTISVTNVATQPPTNNYGKTVFAGGPSIYWPLADAGGPTAADLSGNGDTGNYSATGVTYGAPSPVESASGKGVTLNGSSGQIVASQPITNPTTYSEEMWFKTTTTSGGYLMGFGSAPSGDSVSRDRQVWMSDNGRLNFGIFDEAPVSIRSPKSYNDGYWHQVVATQGPAGLKLYMDGQLVSSDPTTRPPQNYLGYWRVGYEDASGWNGSPTSNYFAATISDVAFYNSEISSALIAYQYAVSPAPEPPNSCPSGWSCVDIGAADPGSQTLSGSTWTVAGGGGDIWGTTDEFRFVSKSLAANGSVSANVTAQTNTDPWAKAGVMLRLTTDPGSPYYAIFVTPGNGVAVQARTAQGANAVQIANPSGTTPSYLKITRNATTFTAYTSANGTTWSLIPGSSTVISALSGSALAGLAVTSHNTETLSTATYQSVTVG